VTMLVAPLYARHKGQPRNEVEEEWSIPWILRFCYLIRALKYIFPICLAVIGFIDFFVTWKYCAVFPIFSTSVFETELSGCFLVFAVYGVLYLILLAFDVSPVLFSGTPTVKCMLFLVTCSLTFCVSPFMLYAIFAAIFSFQSWTIESSEYHRIKWIFLNIVQYLQNDINLISLKYFRIARDRPLRIYIIMFRAIVQWLNIQLFQFLITDYPRYSSEWRAIRSKMELEEHRRGERRRYVLRPNTLQRYHLRPPSSPCSAGIGCLRSLDDTEEYDDPSLSSGCCSADIGNASSSGPGSSSESQSESSTDGGSGVCCDFNFKANDVQYDSRRSDRYNSWCNERYFKSLRPPLAILHEVVASYPQSNIDHINVYNLSQRHLYRYSNETFQAAAEIKNPVYAFSAIALYGWTIGHSALFWVCYHFGFKNESHPLLSFVYLAEYIALYTIYGLIIFNVLHCDRLLTVIQNTSWFDGRLSDIIKSSLLDDLRNDDDGDDDNKMDGVDTNAVMMERLRVFHVHHRRMVQITVQHYMMLHILNVVLERQWLSELVIDYLFGFHAFCDGDGNINGLIKNIIHGQESQHRAYHREWSPSESRSISKEVPPPQSNMDDVPIPTDSDLLGISQRIISTPNIERSSHLDDDRAAYCGRYGGGNLLNDFMEEKYVADRRTSADGMCLCHEDDRGFIRMWDELNLDAIRLQYDAFAKGKEAGNGADGMRSEHDAIQHLHQKTTKSMEFYFDFLRSLLYDRSERQATGD